MSCPYTVGQLTWVVALTTSPVATMEFLLNVVISVTKIFFIKRPRTCHLLCKRPRCYHSISKTCVRDRIFKLNPIHASIIYQIPWIRWNHWTQWEGRILLRESSQGESSGLRVRLEGSLKTHYNAYSLLANAYSLLANAYSLLTNVYSLR